MAREIMRSHFFFSTAHEFGKTHSGSCCPQRAGRLLELHREILRQQHRADGVQKVPHNMLCTQHNHSLLALDELINLVQRRTKGLRALCILYLLSKGMGHLRAVL